MVFIISICSLGLLTFIISIVLQVLLGVGHGPWPVACPPVDFKRDEYIGLGAVTLWTLVILAGGRIVWKRRHDQPFKSQSPFLVILGLIGGGLLAWWAFLVFAVRHHTACPPLWLAYISSLCLHVGNPLLFVSYFCRCARLEGSVGRLMLTRLGAALLPVTGRDVADGRDTGATGRNGRLMASQSSSSLITSATAPTPRQASWSSPFSERIGLNVPPLSRISETQFARIVFGATLLTSVVFMFVTLFSPGGGDVPAGWLWGYCWASLRFVESVTLFCLAYRFSGMPEEFAISKELMAVGTLSTMLWASAEVDIATPWSVNVDANAMFGWRWILFVGAESALSLCPLVFAVFASMWRSTNDPLIFAWSSWDEGGDFEGLLHDAMCFEFFSRYLRQYRQQDENVLTCWVGLETIDIDRSRSTSPTNAREGGALWWESSGARSARTHPQPTQDPTWLWVYETYLKRGAPRPLHFAPHDAWPEEVAYDEFALEQVKRQVTKYLRTVSFEAFRRSRDFKRLQAAMRQQARLRQRLFAAGMI